MANLHRGPIPKQLSPDSLPLFAAAGRRLARPLPLPARRIHDRFGLSPATAVVTAELAGFPTEGAPRTMARTRRGIRAANRA
jgi:hypothetical protein